MLLSEKDIQRLEKAGYSPERFVRYDAQGYAKLRNRRGHCVFYNCERHRCNVYTLRPLGCHMYPVVCSEEGSIIVDDLCPTWRTVSKHEAKRKGSRIVELLARIDFEAHKRKH